MMNLGQPVTRLRFEPVTLNTSVECYHYTNIPGGKPYQDFRIIIKLLQINLFIYTNRYFLIFTVQQHKSTRKRNYERIPRRGSSRP
jgi:hypothetical protein